MSKLILRANLGTNLGKYHVGLSLVEFIEDDVTIIYSPALYLSGYGKNETEAKESFYTAMEEFFLYTAIKKTFDKVLKQLGWNNLGKYH